MAHVARDLGTRIARMPGVQGALDAAAAEVLARAKAAAAAHVDSGAYAASLAVDRIAGPKGVTDRFVYSDDPAAAAIEYGHLQGKRALRWVPGQFILTRAAGGGS
ncbi:DUF5403 family protein [Corynebacterium sphenisci]|uniref:DUF5403 family protein n=1 Tax=Corynebacterium sphenisci TaxID=191493 RepID=UPI00095261EE|nr:DUF5403 family protein [Corynebacterium sphenisci]